MEGPFGASTSPWSLGLGEFRDMVNTHSWDPIWREEEVESLSWGTVGLLLASRAAFSQQTWDPGMLGKVGVELASATRLWKRHLRTLTGCTATTCMHTPSQQHPIRHTNCPAARDAGSPSRREEGGGTSYRVQLCCTVQYCRQRTQKYYYKP